MESIIDQSYLARLKQLIISLKLLDKKFVGFSNKEKLIKNMMESYNKLFLYDLYQGKQLITVTGLQGAGKTRLVRELFDIPEELLPENNSRGEKLPIFISEDNVNEPVLFRNFVVSTEEGHSIRKEKLSRNDFYKKSMNPNENEDLWLECVVPSNFLRDNDKVIVLLPGYEKSNKDFSQKLLDFIVQMSTFSILVLNKNTYARKSTDKLLKVIEEKFENLSPIITLTHGDEGKEQNEIIRNSVIEEMEIDNPERVIVTGRTEVLGIDWKQKMIKEMEKLWGEKVFREGHNSSLSELIDSLQDDIEKVLTELITVEKKNNINEIIKSTVKTPANLFRQEFESYLDQLETQLQENVDHVNFDEEIIELVKENTGMWKSFKKFITGETFEEKINFEKDLKNIWESKKKIPEISLKVTNKLMYSSIESLETRQTGKLIKQFEKLDTTLPKNVKRINDSTQTNESLDLADTINTVSNQQLEKIDFEMLDSSIININSYFMQNIKSSNSYPVSLKRNDYDALVFMGAQFLNNFMAVGNKYDLNLDDISTTEKLNNVVFEISDSPYKDESFKVLKRSMMSLPIILGIDVAVDGEADILNLIPAMVESAGSLVVGLKMSAAAVAGWSTGILTAGSTLFVIKQVMNDVNKSQFDINNNANYFIQEMKKAYVNSIVKSQKIIFEDMERKLVRHESSLRGEDELIGQLEECIYLASNVSLKNQELLKKSYGISPLF